MDFKKVLFIIYSLRFLLNYIKSDITTEKLELINEDTISDVLKGNKFYHVIPPSQILSNYLKITVRESNSTKSVFGYCGNHVISYYQNDSDFKERKQLSQNNTNTVVMWLNKNQYKKDFYLSIEFEKNPCEYYIDIIYNDYIELSLDEIYTYYVTEENKEMNYFYKLNSKVKENITIFAKGDKEIISTLDGIDYVKHSNYNLYFIELKTENNDYNVYFNVTGKVGDLINVGSALLMIFNDKNFYYSPSYSIINGTYYGFLKKGLIENNCFISDAFYSNYGEKILAIALDHNYTQISFSKGILDDQHLLFCIDLDDLKEAYNELFYSFSYYTYNSDCISGDTVLNTIVGVDYILSIPFDTYIGFIPLKLTENFQFLTFSIRDIRSIFNKENIISECSIYTCDNYPLCILDSNDKEKNIPIKKYNEFYDITFTKDELGKNYSPINKEQKLIIIRFKKMPSYFDNKSPEFYVNIYTEISYVFHEFKINSPSYKLIRKDQMEKIVFKTQEQDYYLPDRLFFVFDKITGDISISNDNSKNNEITILDKYEYKNFYLYDINLNLSDHNSFYLFFNITATKDSVYSYRHGEINLKYLKKGAGILYELTKEGNYIFKFDNKNDIIFDVMKTFSKGLYTFINLFSPNCKIGVKNMFIDSDNEEKIVFEKINLNSGFFQEIYTKDYENKYLSVYLEEGEKNKKEACMLYVNNYNIPRDNLALNYSINLNENFPQSFTFNKNRSLLKFEYYFGKLNEDINITFNLLNKGIYAITILVEDKEQKKINNIDSNTDINLKPDNWNNICTVQQKCNLSFTVLSKNEDEESYLQIVINKKEGSSDKDSSSESGGSSGSKIIIILLVLLSIVGLIIIIGVIVFIISKKKKEQEQIASWPEQRLVV